MKVGNGDIKTGRCTARSPHFLTRVSYTLKQTCSIPAWKNEEREKKGKKRKTGGLYRNYPLCRLLNVGN